MTRQPTVLHDVAMQALPRRLPRNEPALSASVVTSTLETEGSPSAARIVPPAVANGNPAQQNATVKEMEAKAFESGYQEGYRKAQQDADQQVRHLAEQLAVELAKEKMQQAFAQATAESEKLAAQAVKKMQSQWQLNLARLDNLLEQVPVQLNAYLTDAEDDMLALVYEVVCRMLGEEGASLPGLRAQLQQCLKAWHGHALLNIELHPDDLALLQSDEESLKLLKMGGFSAERSTLRWVADPRIKVGGCRLRSAEGILDARLEVQLKALEATLLSTRASRKHLASMERTT